MALHILSFIRRMESASRSSFLVRLTALYTAQKIIQLNRSTMVLTGSLQIKIKRCLIMYRLERLPSDFLICQG